MFVCSGSLPNVWLIYPLGRNDIRIKDLSMLFRSIFTLNIVCKDVSNLLNICSGIIFLILFSMILLGYEQRRKGVWKLFVPDIGEQTLAWSKKLLKLS